MGWVRCGGNGSGGGGEPLVSMQVSYLKWHITKIRSATTGIQMSEFYLYQKGNLYSWNVSASVTASLTAQSDEGAENLIDGSKDTKYCSLQWGGSQTGTCDITFDLHDTITIDLNTSYSFATANDQTSRDPISWILYGSIDGTTWTKLSEVSDNPTPTERKTETSKFIIPLECGGTVFLKGTSIPVSGQGTDGQVYLQYVDTTLPTGYTVKEYLATGSTVGAYINTGLVSTRKTYCEIKYQYTAQPTNNTWFFGAFQSYGIILGYQNSNTQGYLKTGGNLVAYDTNAHIVEIKGSGIYLDGELKQSGSWSEVPLNIPIYLFSRGGDNPAINNTRIYYAKIWEGDTLVRYFVPVINNSSVPGMYDLVNGVFYSNAGTQSFTADGTGITFDDEITTTYAKVSGSWQNLIGTDIDDISNTEIVNSVKRVCSLDFTQTVTDNRYVTNTSGLGLVPITSDAIPQAITFDMSKSWSYKLRFKCNSFLNRAMVMLGVCKSVTFYEVSPLIQVNANGAGLWVGASTSGSGWTYQLNLSTTLTAGTWYYVELVWDTTTLSITLYDDTLNQIETDSVSASQIVSQFPMCIGSVGQVATYTSNVITYDLYNCSIKNDGSELW